jgi:ribonuclease VapC
MIVVDASAVVAILFREVSADRLAHRLAEETDKVMSVASYLEAGTVLAGRHRSPDRLAAVEYLDAFVDEADIRLAAVDVPQIRLALDARIRFGRGMGTGHTLNFGDSFSYALAKSLGAPLLFVGRDFSKTDIVPALPESEF